ncbi:Ycf66 family protein [Fischerella sp. JS2]|uniref:Ycf66 family protein n=1 Tax=Fischerella sp. JS2 TaxID=2597771 RepID=UPI0028EB346D|nr:Ycf66 family protein [Fischerella sp. JS2]
MLTFWLNSASVLAQVNFGANSASLLGIFLAIAGAALYFLRTVRPELSRDQDIFFAAVGLLCGFILIFQGWRLDPILQFGQLLLVGSTVFFAVESIRLRGIATQQAKRNTPIVDDEREVSSRYQYRRKSPYKAEVDAELDSLPYDDEYEDERPRPRIPGSRESRSSRNDYYEDEPRRIERRSNGERSEPSDRTTRRRSSSRPSSRGSGLEDDWGTTTSKTVDDWDSPTTKERRPSRRRTNSSLRPENPTDDLTDTTPKPPRRRRPSNNSESLTERQDDDVIPTDYVEYKPINRSEDESDNSVDFDDV